MKKSATKAKKPPKIHQKHLLMLTLALLLACSAKATIRVKKKSRISLFPGDKIWYPVSHFYDLSEAHKAEFKCQSLQTKVLDASTVFSNLELGSGSPPLGQIKKVTQLVDGHVAVLTEENVYARFRISEKDGHSLEEVLRVRLADPKELNCFDIMPIFDVDLNYAACLQKVDLKKKGAERKSTGKKVGSSGRQGEATEQENAPGHKGSNSAQQAEARGHGDRPPDSRESKPSVQKENKRKNGGKKKNEKKLSRKRDKKVESDIEIDEDGYEDAEDSMKMKEEDFEATNPRSKKYNKKRSTKHKKSKKHGKRAKGSKKGGKDTDMKSKQQKGKKNDQTKRRKKKKKRGRHDNSRRRILAQKNKKKKKSKSKKSNRANKPKDRKKDSKTQKSKKSEQEQKNKQAGDQQGKTDDKEDENSNDSKKSAKKDTKQKNRQKKKLRASKRLKKRSKPKNKKTKSTTNKKSRRRRRKAAYQLKIIAFRSSSVHNSSFSNFTVTHIPLYHDEHLERFGRDPGAPHRPLSDNDLQFIKFKLYRDPYEDTVFTLSYYHDPSLTRSFSSIKLRSFEFSTQNPLKVKESILFEKKIRSRGLKNFHSLSVFNNDKLMFMADSINGKSKFFVELRLNFNKMTLRVLRKIKIEHITELFSVHEVVDGHLVLWNSRRKELKLCNILRYRFHDNCRVFKDFRVKPEQDLVSISHRRGFAVVHLENVKKNSSSVVVIHGNSNAFDDNRYKPIVFQDRIPLVVEDLLLLVKNTSIESHLLMEPHFELSVPSDEKSGYKKLQMSATDSGHNKTSVPLSVSYRVFKNLANKLQGSDKRGDFEVFGNYHFIHQLKLEKLEGNIKGYHLAPAKGQEDIFVKAEVRTTEEIPYPFPEVEDAVMGYGNAVTLDQDGRAVQAFRNCLFSEVSRKVKCIHPGPKKRLSISMEIGDHLIDDEFMLFELRQRGASASKQKQNKGENGSRNGKNKGQQDDQYFDIRLGFAAIFEKKRRHRRLEVRVKDLKLHDNPDLAKFVKLHEADFAYLACFNDYCDLYKIEFAQDGVELERRAVIDSLNTKRSQFSPVRILTNHQEDTTFYIESITNQTTPKSPKKGSGDENQAKIAQKPPKRELLKFTMEGQVLDFESSMELPDSSKGDYQYELCYTDQFVVYKKGGNKLKFMSFYAPKNLERNELDFEPLGFGEISKVLCNWRIITVVGKSLHKHSKGQVQMISLKLKDLSDSASYMDDKYSTIKSLEVFEDCEKVHAFNSPRSSKTQKNGYFFISCQKSKESSQSQNKNNNKKLFVYRLNRGPALYVEPKKNEEKDSSTNYKLTIKGFSLKKAQKNKHRHHSLTTHFRVFRKKLESEFDVNLSSDRESRPQIEPKRYRLDSLITWSGFIEQIKQDTKEQVAGFRILDSVRPYLPKSSFSTNKVPKTTPAVAMVKHNSSRIAWLEARSKKRLVFRVWRDFDKFLFDFDDKYSNYDGQEDVQMTMFDVPERKIIYFLFSFYEDTQTFNFRILHNDHILGYFEDAVYDYNLDKMRLEVLFDAKDPKKDIVFLAAREKESKFARTGKLSLFMLEVHDKNNLYLRKWGSDEDDYSNFDYIRDGRFLYIVKLEELKIVVRRVDLSANEFKIKKFYSVIHVSKYLVSIKCQAYDNKNLYADVLGHCVAMTEGRSHLHIQVPKSETGKVHKNYIYAYQEYKPNYLRPQWDLSDNFVALFALNTHVHTNKKHRGTLRPGLLIWKLANLEGTPYRFIEYNPKDHPFILASGTVNQGYDLLLTCTTKSVPYGYYQLMHENNPELEIINKRKVLRKAAELTFRGVKANKSVSVRLLFKKEKIKQDRDFEYNDNKKRSKNNQRDSDEEYEQGGQEELAQKRNKRRRKSKRRARAEDTNQRGQRGGRRKRDHDDEMDDYYKKYDEHVENRGQNERDRRGRERKWESRRGKKDKRGRNRPRDVYEGYDENQDEEEAHQAEKRDNRGIKNGQGNHGVLDSWLTSFITAIVIFSLIFLFMKLCKKGKEQKKYVKMGREFGGRGYNAPRRDPDTIELMDFEKDI